MLTAAVTCGKREGAAWSSGGEVGSTHGRAVAQHARSGVGQQA